MKLLPAKDYILLIDEESQIVQNDYVVNSLNAPDYPVWKWISKQPTTHEITPNFKKVIGYYPLKENSTISNLPSLPETFTFEDLLTLIRKLLGLKKSSRFHETVMNYSISELSAMVTKLNKTSFTKK